jgi:hypothetical protein
MYGPKVFLLTKIKLEYSDIKAEGLGLFFALFCFLAKLTMVAILEIGHDRTQN